MQSWTDMIGHSGQSPLLPQRIVSLVPSQTELLADLGLEHQVVGITKFCVHPERWFRAKMRIGGTKNVHLDRVRALQPDLIIANKEENRKEDVQALAREFPVWTSDIGDLGSALEMIRQVGVLTGTGPQASAMAAGIQLDFDALPRAERALRVAYFIWRDPWMTAGGDTFIGDMLRRAGWNNVYGAQTRYPATDLSALAGLQPELILLSSEPYPFKEQHIQELRPLFPQAHICLVDGERFSWYGSRLLQTPAYLRQLAAEQRSY